MLLPQGQTIVQVSKQIGITDQTHYRRRKEYGGLKTDQARRLKELERENGRLKRLVAELSLDKAMLQEVVGVNTNDRRRTMLTFRMIRISCAMALCGAILLGCQPKLMPTPIVFAGSGMDPNAAAIAGERTTTSRVFYATDRTPRPHPDNPASTYSNKRDFGLRLGVASVDLAPGMGWDELHEESLRAKRRKNPTPRLTSVDEIGPLWLDIPPLDAASVEDPAVAERFASEVQAKLDESDVNEIFIFVHGFNTRFDDNCVIAAELHHYLGSQGVFMSYAWPSRGSLFAYGADKASAQYSIRYFRLFLAFLAERTDARRINIIAHSAGAPVAVGAIHELCLMHYDEGTAAVQSRYRLGQLVLVAPPLPSCCSCRMQSPFHDTGASGNGPAPCNQA